ncbi:MULTISPECIES: cobaltochelatase subunit CobN [unclassified Synechocystis]|uniref:cobaltochelatase subunit CobN n=1 Tax=unclassified Synechocystis TaxID=2640012 RepID=UPI0003F79DEB|nr:MULTISPECIES: cobaltochelatase subunit CobN [unclassified Synechocystis]AIE72539.1 CobN component of cobalt chelatase involved in B12 biosynthesis [Synechocystis sp. PCC 6714]MCT0254458.1 cobaltochelatase subunit CobN [Synechocystis sp. CS-94]
MIDSNTKNIAIIFYRSHYLAGNTAPIDALCLALEKFDLKTIAIYVSSLREPDVQAEVLSILKNFNQPLGAILNTTSFSLAKSERQVGSAETIPLWQMLNVPVLQVILSGGDRQQWQEGVRGLSPRDLAMNVALPEVDGRIITRAISFKAMEARHPQLETEVIIYEPVQDRIEWVAELTKNIIDCAQTEVNKRKVAVILANYPNKDGRLANGVGLDTPASCLKVLKAFQEAGYDVSAIPNDTEALIKQLTQGVTNDQELAQYRTVNQTISTKKVWSFFHTLPEFIQQQLTQRWQIREDWHNLPDYFAISGIQLGNIFVGIQPARGYDLDPSLNYHAPDLEPTLHYLAFYLWLRQEFSAQAIIHLGKHGNLEWLPGKSVALSDHCYPEIALGSLPNFYPFIVNDPGEGTQAKRRSQACIIDHLTPPLTRAELYGDLEKLEALIDEYYEAQALDPNRLKIIGDRLRKLFEQSHLQKDLGLQPPELKDLNPLLISADSYLCELKEAQIRDGLHILGQTPTGEQLRDLIVSIARSPAYQRLGLTQTIALDLGLEFDPILDDPKEPWQLSSAMVDRLKKWTLIHLLEPLKACRIGGQVIEVLEKIAQELVGNLIEELIVNQAVNSFFQKPSSKTQSNLDYIKNILLPLLQQTPQEIGNLLRGLNGEYITSGPAGAPSRGRPDVLPTGRNFYAVDIRAIPTETAWDIGRRAAQTLIERYTQDQGEYPQTLAISIWGTSTMRTGGDDVAQVLALLGVQPVWDSPSRRIIDFEILPLTVLNRPRVDVTVRISGFFRDSFPNLVELIYQAIATVAELDEPVAMNPLAAKVKQEMAQWQQQGLEKEEAKIKATYRIFGSKPGAYGAGLQGLIEAQNWRDDQDLAKAYLNWSCYAYDHQGIGHSQPEVFQQRLKNLQIVLHNQDNREHDLLDSDDYYQFQGGLTAAVRSLTGQNPTVYFGDNANPARPKVKLLTEEIAKVYRSRVVNPKWIAGVMRHGYKGAFEMAATLDYLFAYDATTHCVEDFMYEGVAQAYLLDEKVQNFIQQHNPWALRDMAERLLEAQQRQLWRNADPKLLDQLRAIAHGAEEILENSQSCTKKENIE